MKKRNIIVLLSLSAIILISLINFNNIKFLFSMLDVYISEIGEDDRDIEKTPENPFDQFIIDHLNENADNTTTDKDYADTTSSSGKGGNSDSIGVKDDSSTARDKNQNNSSLGQAEENNASNGLNSKDNPLDHIVPKYQTKLNTLQSEFSSSIDNLISEAASEYSSGASATQIASKYLSKGNSLEKSSDEKINSVLRDLESELQSNDQDTKLVEELRDYYKSLKKNKKSELLSKAKEYL